MKKFVFVLFAFLGIYHADAQLNNIQDTLIFPHNANTKMIKEKATVKLFPNPCRYKTQVSVNGFNAGNCLLQIASLTGKVLHTENRFLFSGSDNMVIMFSLLPGIYFISLRQNEIWVRKRMLVE